MVATRMKTPPKIDCWLDDDIWKTLPTHGDFNMYEPGNEGTISPEYIT